MNNSIPNTKDEKREDTIRRTDAIINPEHEDDNVLYGPFDTVEEMMEAILRDDD